MTLARVRSVFVGADEVVSPGACFMVLDGDLSMWILFKFIVPTARTKPPRSYVVSTKDVVILLAVPVRAPGESVGPLATCRAST